jgi:hypothetical protein
VRSVVRVFVSLSKLPESCDVFCLERGIVNLLVQVVFGISFPFLVVLLDK